MLILFSKHGFFDLSIKAEGDIQIDYHHLVEDMGISLGQAFREALGDKSGIKRYGFYLLPMDETLVSVALDLSNRFLVFQADPPVTLVRDFNIQLFKEFFQAFANEAACNLHIRLEHGTELYHVAEAMFKGFAKALDLATQISPGWTVRFLLPREPCPLKRSVSSETYPKVGVVDYGTGNLRSVVKAFEFLGSATRIVTQPSCLEQLDAPVFPGQGTFDQCIRALGETGLDIAISQWIREDRPYFGICLGLQVLFEDPKKEVNRDCIFFPVG